MSPKPDSAVQSEKPASPSGGAAPLPPPPHALLRWDQVPEDFVECFILSGYRRLHLSAQQCLASAFQPTNETLNFWTHFVPLLVFVCRFGRLLLFQGAGISPLHPALLPLWCYASGVLLTLGMSCAAHLFSCLSLRLRAAFFYLDYASISYYGFASTVAYAHYLLPRLRLLDAGVLTPYVEGWLGWCAEEVSHLLELYHACILPVAFVLALGCTAACCLSRAQGCSYPFAVRTFVFIMPLSMACPVMGESLLFDLRRSNPTLFLYFHRRYLWLLVAAFFNVSKIPERLRPGRFDIVGHSHQLFHLLTALSIYDQAHYVEQGLQQYLQHMQGSEDSISPQPTLIGTLGLMVLLLLCLGLLVRRCLQGTRLNCKHK
ncbi:hypothetical protein NDU88_003649 [Pleurodeles waltl]|uniref:Membrane progestin receptor epsilon n=1 Tax=Pleurodeles waltl TaxID=8319 RepID=A0AAV7LHN0_PLEWA|nr:hypothetical protein NDU88_003649 [Pleurodeles waltl]